MVSDSPSRFAGTIPRVVYNPAANETFQGSHGLRKIIEKPR